MAEDKEREKSLPWPTGSIRFLREWGIYGVYVSSGYYGNGRGNGFGSRYLHRDGYGVWEREDIAAICWRYLGAA